MQDLGPGSRDVETIDVLMLREKGTTAKHITPGGRNSRNRFRSTFS